ncbi:putative ribonuclease H-like domain-containing protein [Tanacetum coccineum]|uniref:Ribonuclease H-like domain-containing protein n=1 Tax=Tanacetum coccineum TaxID=301880 RepID=A0ABQ5B313_9ASTR
MSEPMPTIPTQSPFTYPNPNPSASPSFTQDDTSESFIPEPTQPMPTFTQPAFSQPNQSIFSQPAVHFQQTQPTQTNQTGQQYPNNVQSQQFQQFQTASISANNAKFPYLEKDKYEIWAMKMEYWIQNADHNLWRIVQQGNSPKRLGKDAKGNTIVHPPVSLDEHVAVQRENKVRTLLLQALPEDHMPDFHHYDDARDIWMAVKARFGGNEESKKMRKTMLKQQFTEFSVTEEEEGLHKGYDRFQKILSQLNQVQARPDNDDINLKFLRALPSSWSQVGLALKTRGGLDSMSFDDLYNKLKEAGEDELQHQQPADLTEGRLDATKMSSLGILHRISGRNETDEVAKVIFGMMAGLHADNSGADISNAANEFAMMGISPKVQNCPLGISEHAVKTLESQKEWYHKTQIALEEKIRVLSANLENTTNTLSYTEKLHDQAQKEKKEWEVKFEATLARFEKWKESSKNLKNLIDSSMSTRTKVGLGFQEYFGVDEVFDLSTPSVFYSDPVEKEVKPLYSTFVKAGEMHAVPPPITGTCMPSPYQSDIEETQVSYGSKSDNNISDTISESNDFVSCDNSDKSSDSETHASCDSSLKTQTKDIPPAVDIQTLPESDVEDPNSTTGSPSFSCSENVKSPRIICNKSGVNNRKVCKNNFVRVKKCFVCGSKLHLIKDCDFYNCVDSVPCKSKAASVPAGSRNSSASVPADRSDPAASRNRPAVNPADRPHPAGWSKRPATVSAGRPVSAGWLNPAARPFFRPSSVYNTNWSNIYDPMIKGRWGTAGDPSTDNDIGIVDSGCSRSMTGNKEKLDDFVQIKGGIVKFGGGDGRISGKGTIRTSKLDFENVYYVEELQHFNLFSVSQICDKKNKVLFTDTDCLVLSEEFQLPDASQVVLRIPRKHDLYTFHISDLQPEQKVTCFVAKASLDESTRWHRRMAHVNFKTINKLAKEGLVDGLPLKVFTNEHNCVACNKGKQHKASYKHISAVRLITDTLQLLHMDLFGPTNIRSIDQKYYSLVVTDDFSRFSWTFFLCTKDETFYVLKEFITLIENQLNKKVKGIRCDNGTEFKNAKLIELCGEKGIKRDYSNPRTPQQNGVAERKNRTLIEAARTMLADSKLPTMFWTEAVSTACYVLNRVSITNPHNKTPYELISGKFEGKADPVYLVGTQDHDSDSEVDEQVIVVPSFPSNRFAGPSSSNGPSIMERNADYAEELAKLQRQEYEAKDAAARYGYLFSQATAEILCQAEAEIRNQGVSAVTDPAGIDSAVREPAGIVSADGVSTGSPSAVSDPDVVIPLIAFHLLSTLPPGQQLGSSENTTRFPVPSDVCMDQISSGIFTSSSYDDDFRATLTNLAPAVEVNPVPTKRVNTIHPQSQILGDLASPVMTRSRAQKSKFGENPDWVDALARRDATVHQLAVWKLVPLPVGKHAIGTKWILKNKRDARGIVVRNKARLVAQGHRQEEGIDYDEVFAPVARIEAIRLFLAFASYMGFLSGLSSVWTSSRQPRAWMTSSLGQPKKAWCDAFEELMKGEFEMSAMGEMTFFLGLQVKQLPDGLFISQDKYVQDMLTKFDMESVRTATTPYEAAKTKLKDETDPPVNVHLYRSMIGSLMYLTASRPDIMFAVSACSRHQVTPLTSHLNAVKKIFKYLKGHPKLGLWYPKDSPFQLEAYSDSDYAGSHGDRKSTTGGCQFLGRRLISWQCKKQTIVATSSTEAEYVAAASCCAQVLWIQNQLLDYGFNFMNTKIFIDNQSTICIVKNPVFHQRTKHIEIRHHFIRDANEKNLIQVLKIHTDDNVADLLTKAFDGPRFVYLVVHIGMVDMVFCGILFFLLVSAGSSMVLLVVIFPAARLVSAGCSMVLLVVIFPAARLVSAGCSMVLLVVIFPAARLVSAGCTMVLLVAIVPAGFFVPAGRYGLCCCHLVSADSIQSCWWNNVSAA